MDAHLYSDFPFVSHSLAEFNNCCKTIHAGDREADFIQIALTGEYVEENERLQVLVDANRNTLDDDEELDISRDIDSVLGITGKILVDAPISVWAVPHESHALKSSIHIKHRIMYQGGQHDVPFHQIPNFEFGLFGPRHHLNFSFIKLWTPDHSTYERPWHISEEKRSFWYQHGLRPAIITLLGQRVASDWPATLETEKLRAHKSRGPPAWSTKIIPKEFVGLLADTIRQELAMNVFIEEEDREWASEFVVLHTIRGVKHANFHPVDSWSAEYYLNEFVKTSQLVRDHHLFGKWYIDIGIEISSLWRTCLQWSTAGHCLTVEETLRIPREHSSRITTLSSSKYSRDLVSHLSAVSGYRIEPGPLAAGEFEAVYIQAYTTDKAVTYNREGIHHAKFLRAKDALGQTHPLPIVDALYDIYAEAKEKNSSNARLEVRVPWTHATTVLTEFDHHIFRDALYSFSREDWWDFRLLRLLAISKVLSLQAGGPTFNRFQSETLLLTAGCIWLANSLHARPDDGPASRDLMDAGLPLIEASEALDEILAYPTSVHPENHRQVAYIPFGCIFFRRMVSGEVPRLRISGPVLPFKSFKFWFGMSLDQVQAKYQSAGFVDRNIVAQTRFTTNKRRLPQYVNMTNEPEPDLFNLARDGHSLPVPTLDDASDVEDRPPTPQPDDDPQNIDAELSQLWRQFVSDLTSKSPNPRGSAKSSYLLLPEVQRQSGSEEPYKNLRFDTLFTDVWYKHASREEWETSFRWLFPPPGHQSSTSVQNYRQSPYYQKWMRMLEQNNDSPQLIETIRSEFKKRLLTWSWMPKAEVDKMWPTSAKKPSKTGFTRWPLSDTRAPAPHILVKQGVRPTFAPDDDDVADPTGPQP